jgi:hypothetical protein
MGALATRVSDEPVIQRVVSELNQCIGEPALARAIVVQMCVDPEHLSPAVSDAPNYDQNRHPRQAGHTGDGPA